MWKEHYLFTATVLKGFTVNRKFKEICFLFPFLVASIKLLMLQEFIFEDIFFTREIIFALISIESVLII